MDELAVKDQLAALFAAMKESNSKLGGRSGEMATVRAMVTSLEEIKPAFIDLALWKPKVDQAMGALQDDVGDLRDAIDRLTSNVAPSSSHLVVPPLPPYVPSRSDMRVEVAAGYSGDDGHHGPHGHCIDNTHWGSVMGPPPTATPAKGTSAPPFTESIFSSPCE
jgi:hypothetical protein